MTVATRLDEGPPPRLEGTWRSPGYRSARLRVRAAYVAFGGLLVSVVALVAERYARWDLLGRTISGGRFTLGERYATDTAIAEWTAWYLVFCLATMVTFLAWLSRTVENAPPLGGGTPARSPRQSIGWWFVPVASFFVPYQIVRDLFVRLETPARRGHLGGVLAWWLSYLAANALALVAYLEASSAGEPSLQEAHTDAALWLSVEIANALALCLTIWLIHEVEARAEARAAALHLGIEGEAGWPAPSDRPPPPPAVPASSGTATTFAAVDASCPGCGGRREAAARRCCGCGRDLDPAPSPGA